MLNSLIIFLVFAAIELNGFQSWSWQKENPRTNKVHAYGGLRLWPTDADYSDVTSDTLRQNKFRNLKYVKQIGSESILNEIFVLSYKEDLQRVEKHISILEQKDLIVKHVRGIEGIFEAHKACAEQCDTKMFWVVDADAEVTESFNFDYIPDVYDEEVVHVWASSNPINGLEYGYGGVKLFPTEMVKDVNNLPHEDILALLVTDAWTDTTELE